MTTFRIISASLLAGLLACSGGSSPKYDPTIPPGDDTTRSITETDPVAKRAPDPVVEAVPDPDPQTLDFPTNEEFRAEQPKAGEPRPFQLPAVNKFTLDNGVVAYLVETHSLPTISIDLNFDGGTVTDPVGKEGLASVCMDMLSEGTERLEKIAFNEVLADTASSVSSYASTESHGVSMRTLSKHMDATHQLFVETLRTPGMRDNDFARMISRRLESLLQQKGSPNSVSGRLADSILYGEAHPFGRITTEKSYAAITLDDCKQFHKKWLMPMGAQLFVVGDMTPDQVRERFGAIEGWTGKGPKAVKLPKTKTRAGRIFFVHIPGAAQSAVRLMHFGPKRKDKGYFANDLMSTVLGGGFASRLNMNLREDKGYSYGARGGLGYSRDYGEFVASTSVRSDSTYQTIIEMYTEMSNMASGKVPVTDEELTREKNGAILGLPGSFATSRQALGHYRNLVYFGLSLAYYNSYVDNVGKVTLKEVNKAAVKHLKPGEAIILVVGDKDAAMIHRVDGKDEPLLKDGAPVTLLDALEGLVADKKLGRGAPGQNAFLAREPPRVFDGRALGDRDDLVDDLAIEDLGNEAGADALDIVRARLLAGQYGRVGRLDRDDARGGVALFEHLSNSRDGPAGANAGDERRDITVDGLENLERRGLSMSPGIGLVAKLFERYCSVSCVSSLTSFFDSLLHEATAREHDFDTEHAQERDSLAAHVLRHGDDELVAERRGGKCQCNSSVARRGLDDGGARSEDSARLRIADHRDADSVLDARARVARLHLSQDLGARVTGHTAEADERSATDCVDDAVVYRHRPSATTMDGRVKGAERPSAMLGCDLSSTRARLCLACACRVSVRWPSY